jgi:glycosyltransferase involved in cell wall biosynthesis
MDVSLKIPLVSVLMSFQNAQAFMHEAVESVFAQTVEDWELLLVDDGSTDASSAIGLQYVKRHPNKVRYFQHRGHRNLGLAASRNVGLANAVAEHVAVLDADDCWLPQKLEQQLDILFEYPQAEMVFGASQYWRSWTNDPSDVGTDTIVQAGTPMTELQAPPALLRATFAGANTPPPSNILFRRKAAIEVGGFEECFDGIYMTYEDQAFLAKMYLNSSIFVSDRCWVKYRLHSSSLCAVQEREGREAMVRRFYLRWLERYLATSEVADGGIRRALRKALWASEHPMAYKFLERGLGIAKGVARKLSYRQTSDMQLSGRQPERDANAFRPAKQL